MSATKSKFFLIFTFLGVFSFAAYWFTQGLPFIFILMGPPIHIAVFLKDTLGEILGFVPWDNDFACLLPITMLYYSGIGFHLGTMKIEKRWLHLITSVVVFGALFTAHFLTWRNLTIYYIPHI